MIYKRVFGFFASPEKLTITSKTKLNAADHRIISWLNLAAINPCTMMTFKANQK